MSRVRCQTSSPVLVTESSSAAKMPALLYRTVRAPNASIVAATIASASAALDTSA
jgi:hypothetical protein